MDANLSVRWSVLAVACCLLFGGVAPAAPVTLPDGGRIEKVDFERHVQGLLGKLGCNSGACHGSFQGKGGFFLSLFGYSPEKDYLALTREGMGRRVSTSSPDESLMLLKAAGLVPHGGGKRIDKGSWQYQVIREWIAGGAEWQPGAGAVAKLEVAPKELMLQRPGDTAKLKVTIEFADGSRHDLTAFCEIRVNDDYVAEIAGTGEVKSLRPGDTAVVIAYRGNVDSARALIKVPVGAGFAYPKVPEVNYVDREVFAKLRQLNIVPSELSSDSEFLRRIHIDTIGSLPTPDEVRAFLADQDPAKRAKKIDELLKHPLHAALWATKFCDITGCNVDVMEQPAQVRPKRAKMWHDWFRRRIAENTPYDEIVKGVLCATSKEGMPADQWVQTTLKIEGQALAGWDSDYPQRASLDLFWRRLQFPIEQMGEHTAAAFFGIRLECAQCHKHPFDRWTQDDYRAYANIFATVRFTTSTEGQSAVQKQISEIRQKAAEEQKQVDQAFAEKARPIEEKVDKENADLRKAAEEKIDKENAAKRQELEEKLANDSEEQRKAALAKFDKDAESAKRRALQTVDRDNTTRKRNALASIEKEKAAARLAVQAKYRTPPVQQLREVTIGAPAPRPQGSIDFSKVPPKALGGPEIDAKADPRVPLFDWLRRPDNPYLARSFVNRVWAHYFGTGLVEPVDNFSAANPPTNERLLDALAKDFIESNFDIRRLERTILLSRTYQLSALPNASNKDDRNSYSRSYPRRMMAEVVVDVLNSALGATENFGAEAPPNIKAIEIATNRLLQNQNLANVFRLFGRPPRTSTCDCERAMEPALPQTLFMMTDQAILTKITGGRLRDLLADKKTDAEVLDEMFLATLCRLPTENEKRLMMEHLETKKDRTAAFVDMAWALINTREFILNH